MKLVSRSVSSTVVDTAILRRPLPMWQYWLPLASWLLSFALSKSPLQRSVGGLWLSTISSPQSSRLLFSLPSSSQLLGCCGVRHLSKEAGKCLSPSLLHCSQRLHGSAALFWLASGIRQDARRSLMDWIKWARMIMTAILRNQERLHFNRLMIQITELL